MDILNFLVSSQYTIVCIVSALILTFIGGLDEVSNTLSQLSECIIISPFLSNFMKFIVACECIIILMIAVIISPFLLALVILRKIKQ